MIEIMKTMRLIDEKENHIKTFHLAEGPGGYRSHYWLGIM